MLQAKNLQTVNASQISNYFIEKFVCRQGSARIGMLWKEVHTEIPLRHHKPPERE